MSDIVYAIYCGEIEKGGVYNILASFSRGLLKGFKEAGLKAYSYEECREKNIDFDVALGFNLTGFGEWNKVLASNKINVMWSVDSIFSKNALVFREYQKYENFLSLNISPADFEAAKCYLPNLKYVYMPHATDKDLWKKEECKKDIDIVLFATVYDYESKLENLKNSGNDFLYSIVNEFIDMVSKKPNSTFFELYNLVSNAAKFKLNIDDYTQLYDFVTTVIEQKQKIQMVQALSKFNVQIYGSELWKKYIKGNVQYMGGADIFESIKIMNRAKISLHCHPPQINYGLHERFLNSSSVATFCLNSDTPTIKEIFKDNFGYYNHSTFEDIEEKAQYYLEHDEEREQKAQESMKIVHNNHLWQHRAAEIDKLFIQQN